MEYIELSFFDPLVKKDIEEQLNALTVFGKLNGYKVESWGASRRISLNFTKSTRSKTGFVDKESLGLIIMINRQGDNVSKIDLTEAPSLLSTIELVKRSTKFRTKNGELSSPIKILMEKLGD